jgi:hypothetical protein
MNKVWEGLPKGSSQLLTMLALADWSDDAGNCFPSMASIARKTRLSRSQAQRNVHALMKAGLLTTTRNEKGGAPGQSCHYQIVLKALTGSTGTAEDIQERGRTDAHEGSHGCAETGSVDATLIINEPPVNHHREHSIKIPCRAGSSRTNCPANFSVSDSMKDWAITKGLTAGGIETETESFIDWHTSKGSKHVDWNAAWRTWVRKGIEFAGSKRGGSSVRDLSKQEYGKGVTSDGRF